MTTPATSIYLIGSTITGAIGAAMGSGVFALATEPPAPSSWERLGTAGLISVAAFLMLRWALGEIRRQGDAYAKALAEKDAAIAAIHEAHEVSIQSAHESLLQEVRTLAAGRTDNTLAVRDLTSAIQQQRFICQYRQL